MISPQANSVLVTVELMILLTVRALESRQSSVRAAFWLATCLTNEYYNLVETSKTGDSPSL